MLVAAGLVEGHRRRAHTRGPLLIVPAVISRKHANMRTPEEESQR
jgi:hypothetical protein